MACLKLLGSSSQLSSERQAQLENLHSLRTKAMPRTSKAVNFVFFWKSMGAKDTLVMDLLRAFCLKKIFWGRFLDVHSIISLAMCRREASFFHYFGIVILFILLFFVWKWLASHRCCEAFGQTSCGSKKVTARRRHFE